MLLLWVIFGTILQLLLAIGLFALAVIAGAGLANRRVLSRSQATLLDLSLYLLPLSCLAGAALAFTVYWNGGDASGYLWYSLPAITLAGYAGLTLTIVARAPWRAGAAEPPGTER